MNIEEAMIVSFYSGLRFRASKTISRAKRAVLRHFREMTSRAEKIGSTDEG